MSEQGPHISRSDSGQRPSAGGLDIALPCFWPSISSVKTAFSLLDYMRVLCAVGHPPFLVSAYDIDELGESKRDECKSLLEAAPRAGTQVLLDCGNYERFWHRASSWTEERFHAVLASTPCNLAFSFDCYATSDSLEETLPSVERQVASDQHHSAATSVAPVVRAYRGMLPDLVFGVAHALHPILLAIAERDLGDGIIERSSTLLHIRHRLSEADCYYPIHLLGTGNPRPLILYSLCGADSFDGLEWCRTTVDHDTGLLHHFHHRDLFATQIAAASDAQRPYVETTRLHNLVYYLKLMSELRAAADRQQFMRRFFSDGFVARCEHDLPELLDEG